MRSLGALAVLLVPLLGGAACSLSVSAGEGFGLVNMCKSDADCSSGAACSGSVCVATSYDLAGMLLQVQILPNAAYGGGTSYVIDPGAAGLGLVSNGTTSEPFAQKLDIKLGAPVSIKNAKVVLDPSTPIGSGCSFPDSSIPANITFYRVPRLAGITFQPVQVATTLQTGPKTSYAFDVDLVSDPDDLYDVYIVPQAPAGCMMTIPPRFVPAQTIDKSSTLWQLPPIGTLTGSIDDLSVLDGWELDLVEPKRGLPISAGSALLSTPTQTGATLSAQISSVDPTAWPIVRMTPINPTTQVIDTTRPTVFWSLDGTISGGTTASPIVTLQNDLGTNAVNVQGQIVGSDGTTGVPAQLTIQSAMLETGNVGGNASVSLGLLTAGPIAGQFSVPLPPGDYWIRSVPTQTDPFSITDNELTWPVSVPMTTSCVCGRTFALAAKAAFNGVVKTASGQALASTNIGVSPSQNVPRSYLADTHSLGPLPARAITGMTDSGGGFALVLDRGTSDFVVQPDPSTGLPWLVRPRITPAASVTAATVALTNPAFLSGTVVDPNGNPVSNAEVDAWFAVRDATASDGLAGTLVKIATTSTDANGAYTLVLPSSL